jgi:hypothetical protein
VWRTVVDFLKGNSTPRKVIVHAAIVIGFLMPVWITATVLQCRARQFAADWRKDLQPITCTGDDKQGLLVTVPATTEEKARLVGQFQQTRGRMNYHFDLLATFYQYYFSTIIMLGVLTSVAAVTLLFITSDGWQHSSPYARTIFLVATMSATYCAAFPSIFQQQQNIEDNRGLYLDYVTLTNEMCSYATTGETPDGVKADAKGFIHHVDAQLERLNKIAIGFDITKNPDFYEAIRKGFSTASGANNSGDSQKQLK